MYPLLYRKTIPQQQYELSTVFNGICRIAIIGVALAVAKHSSLRALPNLSLALLVPLALTEWILIAYHR